MSRYRILIPDPLLGMGLTFPPGVSLAGQLDPGPAGTHWHLLDDPGAPAELEGREVELTLARVDGQPAITGRRLIAAHLLAEDGTPACCGLDRLELPPGDRVTRDPQAATCEGARAEAVPA